MIAGIEVERLDLLLDVARDTAQVAPLRIAGDVDHAARQTGQKRLLALSALSLTGIVLVLFTDFRSLRLTTLAFVSLRFALVGGGASAFLTGGFLSLGSLVGFVTVLGIAAHNGVLLISHYRHLEEQEGGSFGKNFVIRGAEARLVPILMTAATALALLPIVTGGNQPGHEIEHPMASSSSAASSLPLSSTFLFCRCSAYALPGSPRREHD
jgi:Cu/Ag efflux pump CusA